MRDLFGNNLVIGQEVVYLNNGGQYRKSNLRKGVIVNFKTIDILNKFVFIKSDKNITITRRPNQIVGNPKNINKEFFEGENHLN